MEKFRKFPIVRFRNEQVQGVNTNLPAEKVFTIFLNDEQLVTVLATPDKLKELAVGFLYTEGILNQPDELKNVLVDSKKGLIWLETEKKNLSALLSQRILTSGCGKGVTFFKAEGIPKIESELKISGKVILNLMKRMLQESFLYHQAGGVHCSALADEKGLISLSEDIGRHNTLDKILGECFLNRIKTEDKIVLSTGRISSEMILKVARAKIPVVASHTAPTDLGIELAEKFGVTVVGYVRGNSMNIYTHSHRLT